MKITVKNILFANEVNDFRLVLLDAVQVNLFFLLIALVSDQHSNTITVTYADLSDTIGYHQQIGLKIASLSEKLVNLTSHPIFAIFQANEEYHNLTIKVTPESLSLFNSVPSSCTSGFTILNFEDLVKIRGKNSKILYTKLSQYRSKKMEQVGGQFRWITTFPQNNRLAWLIFLILNTSRGIK